MMTRAILPIALLMGSTLMATPAYVGGAAASGPNPQVTYSSSAGDLLVAGCYSFSTTATFSISDSAGQTWTANNTVTAADHRTQVFYKANSSAVTWVKCAVTNSGGTPRLVVGAFRGINPTSPLENSRIAAAANSSPASGSFAVTPGDLIVGFGVATNGTLGAGNGFTTQPALGDSVAKMAYQIAPGTSANAVYTAKWGSWSVSGDAFLAAATAAVSPVATPTFDHGAGTYVNAVTVGISDSTSGATLCFTTDGTNPAASTPGTCSTGSSYTAPLTLTSTTTLKVIGTKSGMVNSAVLTAVYTISTSRTFYISNAGSDSNSGQDTSHSWAHAPGMTGCTSVCASTVLLPGDKLALKAGDSWPNTTLTVGYGGISGTPITLTAYGLGPKPVISAPPNSPAITVAAANRGYWTIDGLELRASGRIPGINLPATIYHNYWGSDALPVPGWVVQNCTSNASLYLFGPNTVVRNNAVDGAANSNPPYGGIVIRGQVSTGALIEANTVSNFKDRGIWVYRGADNPTVRYNTVHDIASGTDNGGMGINFDGYEIPVQNAKSYGNLIYACAGIGITHENGFGAESSNNLIHDCSMAGIDVINYSSYQTQPSNVSIHHNVIYRTNVGLMIIDANTVSMANNTLCEGTGTNSMGFAITSLDTNVWALELVNNIIAGAWTHPVYVRTSKAIWTQFDYNLIVPAGTEVLYQVAGGSKTLVNLQEVGLMMNGNTADPEFTSVSARDYSLQSSSPAVGAAVNLGSAYQMALMPGSVWPSRVVTASQNTYGGWSIGAYVFPR